MTWSASGSTCIQKTSFRRSQRRWDASFRDCTGVFELWEELRTLPLFFLNLPVVKLSSFPSQKMQEMSRKNLSPYFMFWPDWKSDFRRLLFTHSLIYSALFQVLLTFPVLPVHQAYPLSSDIIWSEEGENHSHVVWKELTKNYYMTESERLCKWRRNISAYTRHDRLPLPFLRGYVFWAVWLTFGTKGHLVQPWWKRVTHRADFLRFLQRLFTV